MKPRALTAVALAAVALGAAGTAEATTSAVAVTKITIAVDDGTFSGTLSSKRGSCESGRKVTLFRIANGTVKKVGSDVSNDDGDWSVESAKNGIFRARVLKATKKCSAARSKFVSQQDQ